jgi:hypothetical protein
MKYLYIILPAIGIALFGYFYSDFANKEHERELVRKAVDKAVQEKKLAQEAAAREKAIQEALQAQAKRKKEREEREAAEAARKATRQKLLDERDTTRRETERLARRIEVIKKDIIVEQTAKTALEADRKTIAAEAAFQKEATAKALESHKALYGVLENIDAAEKAIAAREAARLKALKDKEKEN